MATILDTIVVKFGDSVNNANTAFATVFLDDTYNKDKTQFGPTDTVGLLFNADPGLYINKIKTTSGECRLNGQVTRTMVEENRFFAFPDTEITLSCIPSSSISGSWYGNSTSINASGRTVKATNTPAIGNISYSYRATSLLLTPPTGLVLADDQSWPIGVAIYVEQL